MAAAEADHNLKAKFVKQAVDYRKFGKKEGASSRISGAIRHALRKRGSTGRRLIGAAFFCARFNGAMDRPSRMPYDLADVKSAP
jgi:hypothetical protein